MCAQVTPYARSHETATRLSHDIPLFQLAGMYTKIDLFDGNKVSDAAKTLQVIAYVKVKEQANIISNIIF